MARRNEICQEYPTWKSEHKRGLRFSLYLTLSFVAPYKLLSKKKNHLFAGVYAVGSRGHRSADGRHRSFGDGDEGGEGSTGDVRRHWRTGQPDSGD